MGILKKVRSRDRIALTMLSITATMVVAVWLIRSDIEPSPTEYAQSGQIPMDFAMAEHRRPEPYPDYFIVSASEISDVPVVSVKTPQTGHLSSQPAEDIDSGADAVGNVVTEPAVDESLAETGGIIVEPSPIPALESGMNGLESRQSPSDRYDIETPIRLSFSVPDNHQVKKWQWNKRFYYSITDPPGSTAIYLSPAEMEPDIPGLWLPSATTPERKLLGFARQNDQQESMTFDVINLQGHQVLMAALTYADSNGQLITRHMYLLAFGNPIRYYVVWGYDEGLVSEMLASIESPDWIDIQDTGTLASDQMSRKEQLQSYLFETDSPFPVQLMMPRTWRALPYDNQAEFTGYQLVTVDEFSANYETQIGLERLSGEVNQAVAKRLELSDKSAITISSPQYGRTGNLMKIETGDDPTNPSASYLARLNIGPNEYLLIAPVMTESVDSIILNSLDSPWFE